MAVSILAVGSKKTTTFFNHGECQKSRAERLSRQFSEKKD